MPEYTSLHKPGHALTLVASAAITGGQVLEVTGDDTVGPAAAGSLKVVGRAGHDAAIGQNVTVHGPGRPVDTAVVVGATVVAGDRLKAAASGAGVTKYVDGTDAVTLVMGLALNGGAAGATVTYQAR